MKSFISNNIVFVSILLLFLILETGCEGNKNTYSWNLPEGIEEPVVPEQNPMTPEKVELGRYLFYDTALSQDETMSCSSCHIQAYAFSDRKKSARGIPHGEGQLHPRNSPQLTNVAYYSMYTWANPVLTTLEKQLRVPLFFTANAVRELGLEDNAYLERLQKDKNYVDLFQKAYPDYGENNKNKEVINEETVRYALASFVRSLVSFHSPYDRYENGDRTAMNESAIRGMEIFNGDRANCSKCHSGFNFSESTAVKGKKPHLNYRHNGLYGKDFYSKRPINERGLREFTLKEKHEGKYRVPTLRNIALTYPYMHDGSIGCDESLMKNEEECSKQALGRVIDHYMSGGKEHPEKDPLIHKFDLSEQEKGDLISFLMSLTDREFVTNPAFSEPDPAL